MMGPWICGIFWFESVSDIASLTLLLILFDSPSNPTNRAWNPPQRLNMTALRPPCAQEGPREPSTYVTSTRLLTPLHLSSGSWDQKPSCTLAQTLYLHAPQCAERSGRPQYEWDDLSFMGRLSKLFLLSFLPSWHVILGGHLTEIEIERVVNSGLSF